MTISQTCFPNGVSVLDPNNAATGVGLSPLIWNDCPLLQLMVDPSIGIMAGDDFTKVQATGFPYEITGDNGTFTAVADEPGVGQILATGADNDECHIAFNNDVAGLIKCDTSHKWWFETRIKLSQIAAEGGAFIGLLEQAASAGDILADNTMALTATLDCIGFQFVEAVANAAPNWRTMMQLAARAAVSETAVAASTSYIKLGMKSVPNAAGTTATVTFYANGAALATTTTTAATDFPLNKYLIPHFGVKTGKAAAFSIKINWWRAAQLK